MKNFGSNPFCLVFVVCTYVILCAGILTAQEPSEPVGMFFGNSSFLNSALAGQAGSLDTTFDGDGKTTTDFNALADQINDIVLQPDGKIVAVGTAVIPPASANRPVLVRYNADGSIDTTFGENGRANINFGGTAHGVAIQPDGKIIVGGFVVVSTTVNDRFVARFNANGTPDSTFAAGGTFTGVLRVPIGKPSIDRGEIGLLTDGKIVVVGTERVTGSNIDVFSVMRLNTNGTLDTTFDGDGRTTTSFVANDRGFDVEILSDNKILAVGSANGNALFALARYNTDGSLDTTFDGDGKVTTSNSPVALGSNSAVQPDGKYLIGGQTINAPFDMVIARYNTDGTLDTTFDSDGRVYIDFNNGSPDGLNTISVQADGKIVGAGIVQDSTTSSGFGVVRLLPNGSLDPTFGTGGKVLTDFDAGFDIPIDSLIQPDGKLVIGGFATFTDRGRDFALARYNLASKPAPFDFDGDGRGDISLYRNGNWYLLNSTTGFASVAWGSTNDLLAPADYDGDGKTDVAVWRANALSNPNRSFFYILNSSNNTVRAEEFGVAGDVPTAGDWDGDGKADLALYRNGATAGAQSNFYYRPSSQMGTSFVSILWGAAGDKAVVGDYDGDSKADAAVFRSSDRTWYIRQSRDGFRATQFGLAMDKLVPADYDGDAKTDIAVYRDGNWYIQQSQAGFRAVQFGLATDRVVPADYDGDGKADIAVYRDGNWYSLRSASGFSATQFGLTTDRPIPSSFLP